MLGGHLEVDVVPSPVGLLVFDAHIREMDFLIEVWQVLLVRPVADVRFRSIRVSVIIGAIAIAFVKPPLVRTLELVIEGDSIDARATLRKALRFAFVRAVDLDVVFELAFAFNAMPERLMARLVAITVTLEHASDFLGQRHCIVVASARDANRLDEALLTEVPEVAGTRVKWTITVVPEITTGDHPKRTDGRERARLRAAQRVLVIAVAHYLSLDAARQVQIPCEWLTRIEGAVWPPLTIAICRARIVSALFRVRGPRTSWPATE